MAANSREQRTIDHVEQVAGARMLADNPFRVAGLAADITDRDLRRHRQRVAAAQSVGAPLPSADQPVAPLEPPTNAQVEQALGALEDPEQRIVAELFWLWGADTRDCRCPAGVHEAHDRAVRSLIEVTDRQLTAPAGSAAPPTAPGLAEQWLEVVRSEDVWAHLTCRMREIGDRRLDEDSIEGLRRAASPALVETLAELAVRRQDPAALAALSEWRGHGADVVEHARDEAVRPLFDRVERQLKQTVDILEGTPALADIERVLAELPPTVRGLDRLVPHGSSRRASDFRNRAAVGINNLGTKARAVGASDELIVQLYETALEFATSPDTRSAVEANLAGATMPPLPETASGPKAAPAPDNDATRQHRGLAAQSLFNLHDRFLAEAPDPRDPATIRTATVIVVAAGTLLHGDLRTAIDQLDAGRRAATEPAHRRTLAAAIRNLLDHRSPALALLDGTVGDARASVGAVWVPVGIYLTWVGGLSLPVSALVLVGVSLVLQSMLLSRTAARGFLRWLPRPVTWVLLLLALVGWVATFFLTGVLHVILLTIAYFAFSAPIKAIAERICKVLEDR